MLRKHHNTAGNEALITMLVIAISIHAFLILSFTFEPPKLPPQPAMQSLDVLLLPTPKKTETPQQADFLAPNNQQGGAKHRGHSRPASPAAAPPPAAAEKKTPGKTTPGHAKQENRKILSHNSTAPTTHRKTRQKPPKAVTKPDINHLLASTRAEITRLTAELEQNKKYASQHPRHKAINAATKEYKYASYLDAWRKKVERIGNLNYPDEAKRRKLQGDLLLHVALRPDGSVQKIRIVRSSGHQLLDDAAIRIVRLAAPFAPFPEEIRKEVDILDITRTWQFQNDSKVFSSK